MVWLHFSPITRRGGGGRLLPQPGHVHEFLGNKFLRWDFRCIGPSSFDCVYSFSQASSQHKYTVTTHLAYDNVHTVLSCPAWLWPSPLWPIPMYSLIRGYYLLFECMRMPVSGGGGTCVCYIRVHTCRCVGLCRWPISSLRRYLGIEPLSHLNAAYGDGDSPVPGKHGE